MFHLCLYLHAIWDILLSSSFNSGIIAPVLPPAPMVALLFLMVLNPEAALVWTFLFYAWLLWNICIFFLFFSLSYWYRSIPISIYMQYEREVKVSRPCPTLCDPKDYTVHGILQARILEWVTVPFSRGSSQPRDETLVSCVAGRFFTSWATREALYAIYISIYWCILLINKCYLATYLSISIRNGHGHVSLFTSSIVEKPGLFHCNFVCWELLITKLLTNMLAMIKGHVHHSAKGLQKARYTSTCFPRAWEIGCDMELQGCPSMLVLCAQDSQALVPPGEIPTMQNCRVLGVLLSTVVLTTWT